MTDTGRTEDRGSRTDQLVGEKRMRDMAVTPPDPSEKRERGQAPARADDDGMAQGDRQVAKRDLDDADRDDDSLDEGLEESMDASDPPSSTQP